VLVVVCFVPWGVSCNSCCVQQHATYRLSGSIAPGSISCPALVAAFSEGSSSRCEEDCTGSGSIPGQFIRQARIESAGPWSADVSVSFDSRDPPPGLDVDVFCDDNQNGQIDTGEQCVAFTSVPAGSHANVALTVGECPGRL